MAQEAQNGGAVEVSKASPVTFMAVKPQLFVEAPKASDAVQFFKSAFGAEEVSRVANPKRKADQELPLLLSAELKLGSFSFLVSDLTDESPAPVKSTSVFCLETENEDAAVAKAVEAGAVSEAGEATEGDGACCGGAGRVSKLKDPYGNVWLICSPAATCESNVEA